MLLTNFNRLGSTQFLTDSCLVRMGIIGIKLAGITGMVFLLLAITTGGGRHCRIRGD